MRLQDHIYNASIEGTKKLTHIYLGTTEWKALVSEAREYGDFDYSILEAPRFNGIRVYRVMEENHLHVC